MRTTVLYAEPLLTQQKYLPSSSLTHVSSSVLTDRSAANSRKQ